MNYYNEWEPFAAQWIRNLIDAGHIPAGHVDERSIVDVTPADIAGYTQVHLFAGIAGWSIAAGLAGYPTTRPLWSASCPCQPYSNAGEGKGNEDERHLWPHVSRLARAHRPTVVVGEQVTAAAGKNWFNGVRVDMEALGYFVRAVAVPACSVNAPHQRDRLWFLAHAAESGRGQAGCDVASDLQAAGGRTRDWPSDASAVDGSARHAVANAYRARFKEWQVQPGSQGEPGHEYAWKATERIGGRRVKPGLRLLANGVPCRVGRLRAYGNAIVPQVACEVLSAYLETFPTIPELPRV